MGWASHSLELAHTSSLAFALFGSKITLKKRFDELEARIEGSSCFQ